MPVETRTYWIPTAGAAGVEVVLPPSLSDATWTCRGCGDSDHGFSELDILAAAGTHAATCGRGTASAKLEADLAVARAELQRVDAKAGTLLALAGAALTVGLAVLGRAGLPAAAAVTGWLAVALLSAGVVLLALAIRPNLAGNHGLVRYAAATDAAALLADVANQTNPLTAQANQLAWTARAARDKYRRVRTAVHLLLAGLAAVAATAALAVLI